MSYRDWTRSDLDDERVKLGRRGEDGEASTEEKAELEKIDRELRRRDQVRDFEQAHAEGEHDEAPREFCPECDRQKGRV